MIRVFSSFKANSVVWLGFAMWVWMLSWMKASCYWTWVEDGELNRVNVSKIAHFPCYNMGKEEEKMKNRIHSSYEIWNSNILMVFEFFRSYLLDNYFEVWYIQPSSFLVYYIARHLFFFFFGFVFLKCVQPMYYYVRTCHCIVECAILETRLFSNATC